MKSLIKQSVLAAGIAVTLCSATVHAEGGFRVMLPINPGVSLIANAPETPVDPQEPEPEPLNDWSLLAADLPDGDSHSAYSFDFATLLTTDPVDYPLSDLNWSADSLPDWLEIDPTSGELSGTPPTYGNTSFTVSADHAAEGTRQQGYTITINGVPLQATHISVGDNHSCAITTTGAAMCWGAGGGGQLGDGSTSGSAVPVPVSGLTSGVTEISAGTNFTCAIHGGSAKCWGMGTNGKLGNGGTTDSYVPAQVSGLTSGVTAISAGWNHACAIRSGEARCWGDGNNGVLGNGLYSGVSLTPIQAGSLSSGVTEISAGFQHTCAIHNGRAKCWGMGGRLGIDSVTSSASPVNVTGLDSGVSSIRAGRSSSCAIHNGRAKCWGTAANGQLGNGQNTGTFRTPVEVAGLTSGVTAVIASSTSNHACAIHNGAAKCWGAGTNGKLGNGGQSDSSIPVFASGLTSGATAISVGGAHTCAIHGGTAKCWGASVNGRLGNGMASGTYPTPVEVLH